MTPTCKSIGCHYDAANHSDFCTHCSTQRIKKEDKEAELTQTMAERYPNYYKPVGDLTEIDVYAVHHLFNVQDPSGCLHHASKKLLLSGVRTGGKTANKDIKEARDTLTRWLQLNEPQALTTI